MAHWFKQLIAKQDDFGSTHALSKLFYLLGCKDREPVDINLFGAATLRWNKNSP